MNRVASIVEPERMYEYMHSFFSPVLFNHYKGLEGSVEDIMDKCKTALRLKEPLVLFAEAHLLMKAVVDIGLERPNEEKWLNLKNEISDILYQIYNGDYESALMSLNGEFPADFMRYIVKDTTDAVSWSSSNPEYLDKILDNLVDEGFNPDFVVPLGHGAYRPGYMLATVIRSKVIPIRFSKYKNDDEIPRLTSVEEEYLAFLLEGKDVLVFDEDSCIGEGAIITAKFLNLRFKPNKIRTAIAYTTPAHNADYVGFFLE